MRVCLYLEGNKVLSRSGIGVALERQKKALDKAGVSYTTDPRGDYDIIHINTILPKSLFYAKRARSRGKRVIMHAHTLEEDTRNSFTFSTTFSPIFRRYLKYFYGHADRILCPSEYAKRMLREYGLQQPITAVSNGIDLERFKPSEEKRAAYRERYGLEGLVPFSVGHVFARKGVEAFVDVAREFDNRFVWFGNIFKGSMVRDGGLKRALETKPDNVLFTGYVDDIVAAYCAGDVFFFPSLAETQGIVILEAWAMGNPVLIRDLPVFQDWTRHGEDCLRAKDEKELREFLRRLLADEGLRKRLAEEGFKAVQEHSLEKVGLELKRVYEEVLDES